jgi:hypothetical protein
MSEVITELRDRLGIRPLRQDEEKGLESASSFLGILSKSLSRRYPYSIKISPILKDNRIDESGGYRVELDLFDFYSRNSTNKYIGDGIKGRFKKQSILKKETGRTSSELIKMIEFLPQKFDSLWFIKDAFGEPYSESNLSEGTAVVKKISGLEIKDAQKKLETLTHLLFRFTVDGYIIIDSINFNDLLRYGSGTLDEIIYRIFNKPTVKSKGNYEIPPSCSPEVRDILDEAINCYVNLNYRATGVLIRNAVENLLNEAYKKIEGKEPKENRLCRKCKENLGEKYIGFVNLYKWGLENGLIDKEYEHFGYTISKFGAIGAHSPKYLNSGTLDICFKIAIHLAKSMEI